MKLFPIIAAALLCSSTIPALAGFPYNVDDPDTAEPGHLVIDAATTTSQVRGSESDAFPAIELNYGCNDKVEATVGTGLGSTRSTGVSREFGYGDSELGAKWRFNDETKSAPEASIAYEINLPTGSHYFATGTGHISHTLAVSLSKSLRKYTIYGNVGYVRIGSSEATDNAFYGAVLQYQLSEKITVAGQIYGNSSAAPGERDELAYGIGFTYDVAPDRELQFAVGRSAEGFSDLTVYAGVEIDLHGAEHN